jgi:signal transduction histidine kinase
MRTLRRRLAAGLAAFALGLSATFLLLAAALVYEVEDSLVEHELRREAAALRSQHAAGGRWLAPSTAGVTLHESIATLPDGLATVLAHEPARREAAGTGGRHYHLLPLNGQHGPPWRVMEVSGRLVLRTWHGKLLGAAAVVLLLVLLVALGLARRLARRLATPLEQLASEATRLMPEQAPAATGPAVRVPAGADAEVAALAQALDALVRRTRAFVAREQSFARDASHELRTPLTVMRSGLERLESDATFPAGLRPQLQPLRVAARLMEQTVHTLLLLAREDSPAGPAPPPVAVLPLVEDWVLAHADALDRQGLQVDLALDRQHRLALPEPVLQRVLAGLLENALAHATPGSTVRLSLDGAALVVDNASAPLPPGLAESGPAEGLRGDHSAGLGLGLAIQQRLLQRHGWSLVLAHAGGRTLCRLRPGAADAAAKPGAS